MRQVRYGAAWGREGREQEGRLMSVGSLLAMMTQSTISGDECRHFQCLIRCCPRG